MPAHPSETVIAEAKREQRYQLRRLEAQLQYATNTTHVWVDPRFGTDEVDTLRILVRRASSGSRVLRCGDHGSSLLSG